MRALTDCLWAPRAGAAASEQAVTEGSRAMTRAELRAASGALAARLVAAGVQAGDRVGVLADRSIEGVVALFGVMRAGAVYVPLDPTSPPARNAAVLKDAGARLVVGPASRRLAPLLEASGLEGVMIDGAVGATPEAAAERRGALAAILYTSGTTGQPKGVCLSHRAVLAFTDWSRHTFSMGPEDRVSGLSPLHFDLSTLEIFATLDAGATLCIAPPAAAASPATLARFANESGVTFWYSVPTTLARLASAAEPLPALRWALFAGEAFAPAALARSLDALPRTRFANLFGPTETNVCTWHEVRRPLDAARPVPIGAAASGAQLRVVDEAGADVEPGAVGELWVSGPSLMDGYWGSTAGAEFAEREGGAREYRTGDLVRASADGLLFLGRRDTQLKVSGFRVAPEEVEAALGSHPGVLECGVQLRDGSLHVIWVARGEPPTEAELRRHCAQLLPPALLPRSFESVSALPRNSRGKLIRVAADPAFGYLLGMIPTEARKAPEEGQDYGPYRVDGELGRGGMGVVYMATHRETGQEAAVKTLLKPQMEAMAALRAEVRALARVQVPGVVRFFEQGTRNGIPWYAMELVHGRTWSKLVQAPVQQSTMDLGSLADHDGEEQHDEEQPVKRHAIGPERLMMLLGYARHLASTLAALHGQGVVHRDLKPANVIVRDDGTTVLMDLGIAWRLRGSVGRENLDTAGPAAGTLSYMAPEHFRAMPSDARSDLWSFGVMLYQSLAGQLPWRNVGRDGPVGPLPPLGDRVEGLPEGVVRLVEDLLCPDPAARIAYGTDVAARLAELGAPLAGPELPQPRSYLYRPRMAGRDAQLARLRELVGLAKANQGQIAVISGESGVGKTFLAAEAAAIARRAGFTLLRCDSVAAGVAGQATLANITSAPLSALSPLLQHIADRARIAPKAWVARVLGDRAAILAPYLPNSDTIALPESSDSLEGAGNLERLVRALRDTLGELLTADGPVALAVDDLQWADETSLTFVASLASDWRAGRQLLVLATCRSEQRPEQVDSLLADPDVVTVELARLSEAEVGQAVGEMLALPNPPPSLVRLLIRESLGIPFFVAEYLRMAVAQRLLVRQNERWTLAVHMSTANAELPVPRSVNELVALRLAGLAPNASLVVECAAVMGKISTAATLAEASSLAASELDAALVELVSRQVLEGPSDEGYYRFVHDKIPQAVYSQLAAERRKTLHRRAAEILALDGRTPAGAIAAHWLGAQAWPQAVDACERAALEALHSGAGREARRFANEAAEAAAKANLAVGSFRRARWERIAAEATMGLGEDAQGVPRVEAALALLGEPALPKTNGAKAFALMGAVFMRTFQAYTLRWWPTPSPTEAARLAEVAFLYNHLLEPCFRNNDPLLGSYCGLRNVTLASRLEDSVPLARGLAMMSYVVGLTPLLGTAHRWAERSVAIADALGSPSTRIHALGRTGSFYTSQGELAKAGDNLRKASAIAAEVGLARQWEEGQSALCSVLQAQGNLIDLESVARQLSAATDERGDQTTGGWARCNLLECLSRRRAFDEAEAVAARLTAWLPIAAEAEVVWIHGALADLHLRRGDPARARESALLGLAVERKQAPVAYFVREGVVEIAMVLTALWERAMLDGAADVAQYEQDAVAGVAALGAFAKLSPYAGPWHLAAQARMHRLKGAQGKARSAAAAAIALSQAMGTPAAEVLAQEELALLTRDKAALERARQRYGQLGLSDDAERLRAAIAAPA